MNAVITGATKGIGKAIALKLAQEGHHLAICARDEKALAALRITLEEFGIKVHTKVTDCSQKVQVTSFCTFVETVFDQVDILVNNVGAFVPGNLLDEADEAFEQQQLLNVNTTYYLSKFFGKMMRKQQSGHIFNICSIASRETIEDAGSYSVTKAAMLSLNHVLRRTLAPYNVKVTAILPGSTLTASWEGTTLPPAQFIQPADIANSLHSILNLSSGANVDELVLKPLNFKI